MYYYKQVVRCILAVYIIHEYVHACVHLYSLKIAKIDTTKCQQWEKSDTFNLMH